MIQNKLTQSPVGLQLIPLNTEIRYLKLFKNAKVQEESLSDKKEE